MDVLSVDHPWKVIKVRDQEQESDRANDCIIGREKAPELRKDIENGEIMDLYDGLNEVDIEVDSERVDPLDFLPY